jgi:hypothetical protein
MTIMGRYLSGCWEAALPWHDALSTPQPRGQTKIAIGAIDKRGQNYLVPALHPPPQHSKKTTGKVASIPFRFKAGGSSNMAPVVADSHHHRSTTKRDKKGFKARHASKGSLKELSKGMCTAHSDERGG